MSEPQHPGRMVNTNSRTAAYLRHAGLAATDVAGEGPWVTMAEAEAEAARRGITVNLPEPKPPMPAAAARGYVRKMQEMGAHLMRLTGGSKTPVENAWQDAPALTEDEATAWLVRGENIGINLLRSGTNGWVVLDAENSLATADLKTLGFTPTALTANAQDQTSDKFGGCHVWLPLPDGIDPAGLKSTLQKKLPSGGVLDVLAGVRYAVAPGTTLESAPGLRYAFANGGGAVNPDVWVDSPLWLVDSSVPPPDGPVAAVLHGAAGPKIRVQHTPRPDADRISREIDEIPWEDWLDDDPRVQILGVDGSCGCPVFHWAGASTQRSGILHEGCEWGYGVHAFSGTLISIIGREHASRLQFAAFLRGREDDLSAVAREFGITMGGPRTTGFSADDIAQMIANRRSTPGLHVVPDNATPAETPEPSNSGEATENTAVVSDPQPTLPPTPRIGSVTGVSITDGASALTKPMIAAATPGPTDVVDDVIEEPVEVEDTGLAMFRKIKELEESTQFWAMLPFLRRLARAGDSNGCGRWGLLGATLPRIACSVPPFVRLVSSSGRPAPGNNGGTSINLNTILTGPPEEGKSEVIKLSEDLVFLPQHAVSIASGTGEGIMKSFVNTKKPDTTKKTGIIEPEIPIGDGGMDGVPPVTNIGGNTSTGGYEVVHLTDTVMQTSGEISGMISEMKRQGTKATSVYRSAWMGEALGSTTGEVERRTYLAAHSYRFGAVLGAQIDLDALAPIFDEGKLGSPQRFIFLPVTSDDAVGEPIRSMEIPYIDWYDGQAASTAGASLVTDHPPVWIRRPTAADEEIRASRAARKPRQHLAYSTAEVRRRADDDESFDDIRGHELLHQLKIAAVLAIADGLRHPENEHWYAARVVMQVREIVMMTLLKVILTQRDVADRKRGRSQGRSAAEARRAEAQDKRDYVIEVANRINEIIDEKGAPASEAEIFKKLSKAQQATGAEALAEMLSSGVIQPIGHRNSKGKAMYWFP